MNDMQPQPQPKKSMEEIILDIKDLTTIAMKKCGIPVDEHWIYDHPIPPDSLPRLQAIVLNWSDYREYLKRLHKDGKIDPSVPVWITESDDSFKINYLNIGPRKIYRDYFSIGVAGDTEIIWPTPREGQGFQWWILSWFRRKNDSLAINVTHWILDHDTHLQRNTVYLTRFYTFQEPEYPDPELMTKNEVVRTFEHMDSVPIKHREMVRGIAKEALKHDDPSWPIIVSPYGTFELLRNLQRKIEDFDFFDLKQHYLDREFKNHIFLRLLKVLYGDEIPCKVGDQRVRWSIRELDVDGIPKEFFYVPNTEHFMDQENFEIVKEEWLKFRQWYNVAQSMLYDIIARHKPFAETLKKHRQFTEDTLARLAETETETETETELSDY